MILPLLALLLVGVLSYKAVEAERSQVAVAERTLRDYASFATWEYVQRSQRSMMMAVISSLVLIAVRIDPTRPSAAQPTPAELEGIARARGGW